MGVRYSCDGCDQMIPEGAQPEVVGTVLKREYCETCAPTAKSYMAQVSGAHTEIAKQWQEKLRAIRERYMCKPSDIDEPLIKLPDTN